MKEFGMINIVRGLLGGICGAVAGYFLFTFLLSQGFYALAIPGCLIGMGCGWSSGIRSSILASNCCVWAIAVSLFAEWRMFPFTADPSLGYFLRNLKDLTTVTWAMILIGCVCAFWFGLGRNTSMFRVPAKKQ